MVSRVNFPNLQRLGRILCQFSNRQRIFQTTTVTRQALLFLLVLSLISQISSNIFFIVLVIRDTDWLDPKITHRSILLYKLKLNHLKPMCIYIYKGIYIYRYTHNMD